MTNLNLDSWRLTYNRGQSSVMLDNIITMLISKTKHRKIKDEN